MSQLTESDDQIFNIEAQFKDNHLTVTATEPTSKLKYIVKKTSEEIVKLTRDAQFEIQAVDFYNMLIIAIAKKEPTINISTAINDNTDCFILTITFCISKIKRSFNLILERVYSPNPQSPTINEELIKFKNEFDDKFKIIDQLHTNIKNMTKQLEEKSEYSNKLEEIIQNNSAELSIIKKEFAVLKGINEKYRIEHEHLTIEFNKLRAEINKLDNPPKTETTPLYEPKRKFNRSCF